MALKSSKEIKDRILLIEHAVQSTFSDFINYMQMLC